MYRAYDSLAREARSVGYAAWQSTDIRASRAKRALEPHVAEDARRAAEAFADSVAEDCREMAAR